MSGGVFRVQSGSVDQLQMIGGHLAAATVGDQLVADLLTFAQFAVTGTLDSADMDEGIVAAVIGGDETKTLLGVKPLHGSRSHGSPFVKNIDRADPVDRHFGGVISRNVFEFGANAGARSSHVTIKLPSDHAPFFPITQQ